jgi:hypothetical protein
MKSDSMNQFVDRPLRALVVAGAVLMAISASVYKSSAKTTFPQKSKTEHE